MTDTTSGALEAALDEAQARLDATLRAAAAVTGAIKRARAASATGSLRDLRTALAAAEQASTDLGRQVEAARAGWTFDEEAYFTDGGYVRELLDTAQRMGVAIHEQDARLYCYPSLVRVLPGDRAVMIDRVRDRRMRPSVLVAHLRDIQNRPARFSAQAFIGALAEAYRTLDGTRGRRAGPSGQVQRLRDIYEVLTLLPGQSREYSVQEFARDVYLLDQSGVTATRQGEQMTFEAGTGTRSASATLTVITRDGRERRYYGIMFTQAG